MRRRFPFGLKGLLVSGAVVGTVVFWRVRSSRREAEERRWEEEIAEAVAEGSAAGSAATGGRPDSEDV